MHDADIMGSNRMGSTVFGFSRKQNEKLEEARIQLTKAWLVGVLGDSATQSDMAVYLTKRSVEPKGWWGEAKLGNFWCLRYVAVNYLLGTARPPNLEKSYFWLSCARYCADYPMFWREASSHAGTAHSKQTEQENKFWEPWENQILIAFSTASPRRCNKLGDDALDWHSGLLHHIRANNLPNPQERTALWRANVLTEDLIDTYGAYLQPK